MNEVVTMTDKYKYYSFHVDEEGKKVIAVTHYAGRAVRGIAKCAPEDTFDVETGCKIAVIDDTGKLLDVTTVYPTEPQNDVEGSKKTLLGLIEKHKINMIAIGNGTASRESEMFVADMIKEVKHEKEDVLNPWIHDVLFLQKNS